MSAVSEWELRLPIGDPDQPLDADALSDLPSALPPGEQRELARDLLLQGRLDGLETVGAVHDRLAGMSPSQCRRVLDGARRRSGLALTAEVEFQERHEVDQRNAQVTAGATSGWQLCHAADCNVSPVNSAGAPVP